MGMLGKYLTTSTPQKIKIIKNKGSLTDLENELTVAGGKGQIGSLV